MPKDWDAFYRNAPEDRPPAFVVRAYGPFVPQGPVLDLAGSVVVLMERFPGLEKVAYALVGWAGVKLFLEGTHTLAHLLHRPGLALALPKAVFRGGTCLILTVGGLLAFRKDA